MVGEYLVGTACGFYGSAMKMTDLTLLWASQTQLWAITHSDRHELKWHVIIETYE